MLNPRLGVLMRAAEDNGEVMALEGPGERDAALAQQLYYVLLMLCRGQPLTLVVNAGKHEGLLAWRALNEHF